jgi:hypothetical protein
MGGTEGYGRAQDAFNNSLTGGDFALDFANNNYMRNAASLGQLNSGGTAAGLYELGRGFQNQRVDNFQNRLAGFDPTQAVGMRGNALTNQGNFRYGLGRDTNSSYQNQASNMLSLGSLQENQRQFNESQTPLWEKLLLGGVSALGGAFGA